MAWQTKLEETDYRVSQPGANIQIWDSRNGKGYLLSTSALQRISAVTGTPVHPNALIQEAIRQAMIPHPYEEYV